MILRSKTDSSGWFSCPFEIVLWSPCDRLSPATDEEPVVEYEDLHIPSG